MVAASDDGQQKRREPVFVSITSASEMKAAEVKAKRALRDAMGDYLRYCKRPGLVEELAYAILRHADSAGDRSNDFDMVWVDLLDIAERLRSLD